MENARVRILVIDVGGTHIKVAGSWDRETHRIPSGPTMTPAEMVAGVLTLTRTWDFEAISLGYPGPVKDNRPTVEPVNIGKGWTTFDFQKAFGKPVKVMNDAAMQALGSYAGGRMLFLGLGTGLGNAIVDHWRVEPLELAHLPYAKGETYEDFVGERGLKALGEKKWEKHVHIICDLFRKALLCDAIVLGGGNARRLKKLPEATTRGANENAITGGIRLWEAHSDGEGHGFELGTSGGNAPAKRPASKRSAAKKRAPAKRAGAKRASTTRTPAPRRPARKTKKRAA
jgi:polyphosphate glucokinase